MPYTKGQTPEQLKDKGIPRKYIDQFIEVFNSVYEKDKDEASAYAQAYGVMTKALNKDGYRQGKDKKWHKITKKEAQETDFVPVPGMRRVILEAKSREEALLEGLKFTGVALVDHAVSQQGTGSERYYSPEFNEHCLARTNEYMEQGHVVTIYNSHGSALGSMFSAGPDRNPIGKMEEIWRDGEDILYRGFISATGEGQDVIRLMLDGIRNETSVRIYDVEAETKDMESDEKEEYPDQLVVMREGYIGGIDFCDEAGIPGAGLVQILESAPRFQTQEDTMLTLDVLKEEHPDLVSAIVAEKLGVLSDLVAELKEENKTLAARPDRSGELTELQAKVDELTALVTEAQADLIVERAAQGPLQREIVAMLKEKKPEDMEKAAAEYRDAALNRLLAEHAPDSKGKTQFTDEDQRDDKPDLPADEDLEIEGTTLHNVFADVLRSSAKRQ
ncbi:MAG: hypothetical protein WC455_22780 [Dehalococcoidia bacterium]|jgi:hypothetical protein